MASPDEQFDDSLVTVDCPWCETTIRGTANDIDSGLRKHLDYCDDRPDDDGE